jgi:hypothetical protein
MMDEICRCETVCTAIIGCFDWMLTNIVVCFSNEHERGLNYPMKKALRGCIFAGHINSLLYKSESQRAMCSGPYLRPSS